MHSTMFGTNKPNWNSYYFNKYYINLFLLPDTTTFFQLKTDIIKSADS
jgi:hypothetical protein